MSDRLPGPRGLDHVRALRQIFSDPTPVLVQLRATYGPICALGAGPARMVVVGDPTLLHEMFAMPTETFRWGHKFNVLGFVVGKGSMIVSDGPDHRRRRASVQSAFSRRRLNGWIPMIVERTDAALDALDARLAQGDGSGEVVDLYPIGRRLVLGIAIHALFGPELAERADEIGDLFQRPQDYLESAAIKQLPHPLPHTARARVRDDRRALDAIVDDEIEKRRQRLAPGDEPADVLDALVRDGSLSDAEIRDQVVTLIGAGYDTTAAALAWILWCAALEPAMWARLRAEADAVLGSPDNDTAPHDHSRLDHSRLDHTHLAALGHAHRVMRETLRLHPPGVLSPREAASDITLGGHDIRKGTLVLWSALLAGRDPGTWADPLRFDPDRFAELTSDQKAITDQGWVPFGRGARNCIGFALAQMELTLITARIAERLDVEAVRDDLPRPVGMVVNRPEGGTPLRVVAAPGGRAVTSGDHWTTRVAIARACRVMAHRGLVEDVLGHISLRVTPDLMLLRCRGPREQGLRFTEPADVRVVDLDGRIVDGGAEAGYVPPSEAPIHVETLRRHADRPDEVAAVVHAHPPAVVAADLAGLRLQPIFGSFDIPAARLAAGGIPVYPRSVLIRRAGLAHEMLAAMGDRPVCVLRGHGVVAVGATVEAAVLRALAVDRLSRMASCVVAAGGVPRAVPESDLAELPDLGAGLNEDSLWRFHLASLAADGWDLDAGEATE